MELSEPMFSRPSSVKGAKDFQMSFLACRTQAMLDWLSFNGEYYFTHLLTDSVQQLLFACSAKDAVMPDPMINPFGRMCKENRRINS